MSSSSAAETLPGTRQGRRERRHYGATLPSRPISHRLSLVRWLRAEKRSRVQTRLVDDSAKSPQPEGGGVTVNQLGGR